MCYSAAGAIGTFVSTTKLPILDPKNSQAIIIVWLATSAVADSIITGTLLFSWVRLTQYSAVQL